jgi:hypothetical protein
MMILGKDSHILPLKFKLIGGWPWFFGEFGNFSPKKKRNIACNDQLSF